MPRKTCFVVMGFGKKVDFETSKTFDLDMTYQNLIKPAVEAAGCGTCVNITGHLITGDDQVVISSANRNFKGRLGNAKSEIWVGSAATVAASALTGFITDPREVAGGNWRAAA